MKKINNVFCFIAVMFPVLLCSGGSCSNGGQGSTNSGKVGGVALKGQNLLKNGGFEAPQGNRLPENWEIIPAYKSKGKAGADTKVFKSGQSSIKISPNSSNKSGPYGVFQMLNANAIKGQEVIVEGYIRTEKIGESVAILFDTGKENWLPLPKDTGNKFVPFNQKFSVANSASKAGVLLLVAGTKGSVWFDDLSVSVAGDTSDETVTQVPDSGVKQPYVDKINTPGWQDSVYISGDGNEMYFAYLPFVQKDFMDLYFKRIREKDVKSRGPFRPGAHGKMNFETYKSVRKADGSWSKPLNININSTFSLYSAKLSHDGNELYYAIRDYKGNYGADDIYVSKKLADGTWSKIKNLGPNINTKHREDTPCLTTDGNTMYFARNEHEMLGWEIMVSYRRNGKWTKAEKVGPPLNQANPKKTANYQPFITADGKEFYFTRIQQMYMSKRKSDGSWGKPVAVFPQMLVSAHASVTDDNKYLYFLSAKDKASFKREHWTIWFSERKKDGTWGNPKMVD